jgi:hypothetical protein
VGSRRAARSSRPRGPALALGVALGLALVPGCTRTAPLTCTPLAGGVDLLVSTGPGVWAERGVEPRLVELWRVGGLHEDQQLGYPVHAAANSDDVLAVPDFMLNELILVGPDGEWRQGVLRRGAGPGELGAAVAVGGDGARRLAVLDVVNGRILVLEDGRVTAEIPVPLSFTAPIVAEGELIQAGVHPDGSGFIQPGYAVVRDAAEPTLRASILYLAPGAAAPDTLVSAMLPALQPAGGRPWRAPGHPMPWAAMMPDGGIAVSGLTAEYAVLVHDAGGRPIRQICRPDAADKGWTAAERGEAPPSEEYLAPLQAQLRAARLPARPAAVGRVMAGADGRIWVQRDRAGPYPGFDTMYGPAGGEWDVFEANGTFLGTLAAPAGARLQAASADRVWAFITGEFDETTIVAYRLQLSGR